MKKKVEHFGVDFGIGSEGHARDRAALRLRMKEGARRMKRVARLGAGGVGE